ncbi:MAG: hypothetical protein M0Z66_05950 [Thermaerobacter sp.]|nr:hypothetical protein [Thermaerobacter sp.]
MAVIEVRREVTFSPAGPFRLGVTARVEATDIKKKKLSRKDVSRMATPAVSKIALMLALLSEQLTGGMPLITPPTASEDDVRLIGDSEQVVAKGTT